jgi:hypothetical protein
MLLRLSVLGLYLDSDPLGCSVSKSVTVNEALKELRRLQRGGAGDKTVSLELPSARAWPEVITPGAKLTTSKRKATLDKLAEIHKGDAPIKKIRTVAQEMGIGKTTAYRLWRLTNGR